MEKTQKWKSQFMTVALGQAVSMLGSHGVQFALIWWLAEKTSSPLMLGISGLVAYLPMTLFSPLAGIAADRYNRKIISIFSDMAIGAVALIYAVLLFFLTCLCGQYLLCYVSEGLEVHSSNQQYSQLFRSLYQKTS